MLKKKLIPTPLPKLHSTKMEVKTVSRPPRFRTLFIATLLVRSLWHIVLLRIRPSLAKSGKHSPENFAREVRLVFERLGGMWIKTAQILAMRRDIFSVHICNELSQLHDHATGFPGEVAVKIIEEELKRPIREIFSEFDVNPIAAASIGQVHVGRLRENGVKVAVKVQRPTIADSFRKDLSVVRLLVNFLGLFPSVAWLRWDEMYATLAKTLTEELDYRIELSSTRKMRKALKWQKIYAPKPYQKYSSRRVLVAEFVHGQLMSEYLRVLKTDPAKAKKWCKENKIKPKTVGRKLFMSMVSQVTVDNILHSDLHPGNIMMLRKNRFAFIDFGSVNSFDKQFLEKYRMLIRALAARDWSKYVDTFLTMVPGVPLNVDLNTMRKELVHQLEDWETLTSVKGIGYEPKSLSTVNTKLVTITSNYRLPFVWDFLRYLRSLGGLDASMAYLDPDLNFLRALTRQVDTANRQMLRYLASKASRQETLSAFGDALRLPKLIGESFFFEAELGRKRALAFQGQISKAARIGRALLATVFNIGLMFTALAGARYLTKQSLVGSDLVAKLPMRDIFSSMPQLSPGMWVVMIILFLYLLRSLRRLAAELGVTSVGTNPFV